MDLMTIMLVGLLLIVATARAKPTEAPDKVDETKDEQT